MGWPPAQSGIVNHYIYRAKLFHGCRNQGFTVLGDTRRTNGRSLHQILGQLVGNFLTAVNFTSCDNHIDSCSAKGLRHLATQTYGSSSNDSNFACQIKQFCYFHFPPLFDILYQIVIHIPLLNTLFISNCKSCCKWDIFLSVNSIITGERVSRPPVYPFPWGEGVDIEQSNFYLGVILQYSPLGLKPHKYWFFAFTFLAFSCLAAKRSQIRSCGFQHQP